MNEKIQKGFDLIGKLFTKKIGELGVYVGAELILGIIAAIPLMIFIGGSLLSIGSAAGGFGGLRGLDMDMLSDLGKNMNMSMLLEMFKFMMPMIIGGLVTLAISFFLVMPIMTVLRTTLISMPEGDFSENLNIMRKNVLSKYGRMIGLYLIIALLYVAMIIAFIIVVVLFALLAQVLGAWVIWLLVLILIAAGIFIAYFAVPIYYFAPFDAVLSDKPVMTCITDALNAKAYRLPLIAIIILFGIASGIVTSIFAFIPIPFLIGIIASVLSVILYTIIYPFYKEYAGSPL